MPQIPWIPGTFKHVLSPPGMPAAQPGETVTQWYINDHCVFVDADDRLHWYGITNPYPESGSLYGPGTHRHIGHAVADHPFGPWRACDHAFALPPDTTECIGACFVAPYGDSYRMLYGYNGGFHVGTSPDLHAWSKLPDDPVLNLGQGTRDPCLLRLDDGTWLLYAAAGCGDRSAVALATSPDLDHWQQIDPALLTDIDLPWGVLESPFVHRHCDDYYLFINHSHRQYEETLVFHSRDPFHFDWTRPLCTLFAHAAEIFTWQGRTYITHCGIEDRHWSDTRAPYGLWLAELQWMTP